uniref:Small ribosomal subunit protein uS17c n=1 Tax=Porolithon onkodes TaxID=231751 RepID=A0A2Z2L5W3_9FLOR|nr:30S ribosomal protein S17 [Porolithon onkodes]ASB29710.1 30S ribosomal protein S17 [Porolithon onkodes]
MVSKEIIGTVISNKMNKTIIVAVNKKAAHKKYKKTLPKTKKYFVHDEYNQYKTGDVVKIILSRPLSKNKCWKVLA